MKPPNKLLNAAILPALLILSGCQTPKGTVSLDVTALQKEAADAAVDRVCLGQEPRSLDSIAWVTASGVPRLGVTEDEYRAMPEWVKIYIVGNDDQWIEGCGP